MDARGFAIVPLAEVIAAPVRTALGVLLAGVLFLLAIAVTNAMNLQLSLAIRREREFAVRAALEGSGGVCLRWTHAVDGLIVEIVDGGPGLPPSENLFVPFFTTKPGGSGIGLVLARQIAEAHGGRVTLENRADAKGCLARLWLPA
ncbi:ATP-binding protein [Dokdonella sp.]|uniref:ATP-binding protein n=1 Tax=Dokdonella sp. TaxID=2291710 RepID=UPI0031B8AF4A